MKEILRGLKTAVCMVRRFAMPFVPLIMLQVLTCGLVFVFSDLVQPLLYSILFDSLGSGSLDLVFKSCLIMAVVVALMLCVEYLNNVILDANIFRAINATCIEAASQYHRLPYFGTVGLNEGDVYNRIHQGGQFIPSIWTSIMMTAADLIGVCVMLALCFRISPYFAIAAAALSLLTLLRMKIQAAYSLRYAKQQEDAKSELEIRAYDVIHDMEFAVVNGVSADLLQGYRKQRQTFWAVKKLEMLSQSGIHAFFESLSHGIRILAPFLLLKMNEKTEITYGMTTSTFAILDSLQANVPELSGRIEQLAKGLVPIERLAELLPSKTDAQQMHAPSRKAQLSATNLSVRVEGKLLLDNISICISPGEKVAVIGRNGSGKSTLLRALMGHYKPDTGTVCLNTVPVVQLNQEARRAHFSFVPATPQLFSESGRDNILMGASGEERWRIDTALNQASLEYSLLSKNGLELSGGQAQRMAIARARIHQTPILVLDEPTSALDKAQGRAVIRSVLQSNQTVIIATHDGEMLPQFPRILLMENARIVADGSIEELKDYPAFKEWIGHRDAINLDDTYTGIA